MKLLTHYHALAELFEYPDGDYPRNVRKVIDLLDGNYSVAVADLERFLALLPAADIRAMQELFTRTFDVQSITTLDIGYVLFGDDYKRGELLANLNREHKAVKNDCRRELADHLPNLLRLLAKLSKSELTDELTQEIIAPALRNMIDEFTPERIEKKHESYRKHYKTLIEPPANRHEVAVLYQFALRALYDVLKRDFEFTERTLPQPGCDFLRTVARENEIEIKANSAY